MNFKVSILACNYIIHIFRVCICICTYLSHLSLNHCRNQANNSFLIYSDLNKLDHTQGLPKQAPVRCPSEDNASKLNNSCNQGSLDFESNPEILGPDTPAMRPRVPRLKRIQEDCYNLGNKHNSLFLDHSKRIKSVQDSRTEKKASSVASETASSKFEWLDPSLIRDADGRRPGDALYDKRTLYIPPTVLRKMSASQKQYWSVKCNYMDVILFFKVVNFCGHTFISVLVFCCCFVVNMKFCFILLAFECLF